MDILCHESTQCCKWFLARLKLSEHVKLFRAVKYIGDHLERHYDIPRFSENQQQPGLLERATSTSIQGCSGPPPDLAKALDTSPKHAPVSNIHCQRPDQITADNRSVVQKMHCGMARWRIQAPTEDNSHGRKNATFQPQFSPPVTL